MKRSLRANTGANTYRKNKQKDTKINKEFLKDSSKNPAENDELLYCSLDNLHV